MTIAPWLAAPLVVQLHSAAALLALLAALVQLAGAKGTSWHRLLGRVWVGLMAAVALSSFGITAHGGFSWIHALSVGTLAMLPVAVLLARRGRIRAHRTTMLALVFGALVITGAFTLLPGRLMGLVVFG